MNDTHDNPLALHGGSPVIPEKPERKKRWGAPELERLSAMVEQKSLFYWENQQTRALETNFRTHYDFKYLMPCSSGSAALHIAVAAAGIKPGDEVITTCLTDMGTLIGILYQQGVPVFADIDPRSYNLDPVDVEKKITKKTRAIIAVHLFGNPCNLEALGKLAKDHKLALIEDCAQSWGAKYRGTPGGLKGDIACYSFNDFKHISCGDGGMAASNREDFGPRLQPFGDKGYGRRGGSRNPAILAPNYRMAEPQAAVAASQLERLHAVVEDRATLGNLLDQALEGVPGILRPERNPEDLHSTWFYTFRLDLQKLSCDRDTFAKALIAEGVLALEQYMPDPVYQWSVFQNHAFFEGSWPIREQGKTTMDYRNVRCPVAESVADTWIPLVVYEGMDSDYVDGVGEAVRKVMTRY